MGNIREPVKKKAIATKEMIIDKGFELICNEGYHNVNTASIAKYANISTGNIYQYFHDKHEILLAGLNKYLDNIMFPFIDTLALEPDLKNNFPSAIKSVITKTIEVQNNYKKAYHELLSLENSDIEVFKIFKNKELEATIKVNDILNKAGYNLNNQKQKAHFLISIINLVCEELNYHNHTEFNYDGILNEVIRLLMCLFYNCPNCKLQKNNTTC